MRVLLFLIVFSVALTSYGQPATKEDETIQVKEELKKFWKDLQDAAVKKDRKALEGLYADEFIFIHSSGQEDNKQKRIDITLGINDYSPAPMPSFDEMFVYGDVAVLRATGMNRGTTIFVKKHGQWQVMQVQSTIIPPERKTVKLDVKVLDQYVGKYEQAPGVSTTITRQGDTLIAKGMNRPPVILLPVSETKFFVKDNVGEFNFYKDEKGMVTHFILQANGRETKGTKLE